MTYRVSALVEVALKPLCDVILEIFPMPLPLLHFFADVGAGEDVHDIDRLFDSRHQLVSLFQSFAQRDVGGYQLDMRSGVVGLCVVLLDEQVQRYH